MIQNLASEAPAVQNAAVHSLKERADAELLPLFSALQDGLLYKWSPAGNKTLLVTTGDAAEGQEQLPLLDPMTRQPILKPDGTQAFDLPDHLLPEFPPPIFLQMRPELGDVSKGQVVTTKNFFKLFNGIITPVQMEGLRLLLTPFPQEEFNQTDDRKVAEPQFGVACLDCHTNFHTNAAFHLNPDTRPQDRRFRIDTVSLRGLFNQQIHGSKRSLRSVEDFTEFEQRTAYFNGDHVSADRKGTHKPNRTNQVSLMAQMQNMIDFPPAPKLDATGKLDRARASKQELAGEKVFLGKGRCAECHGGAGFLDHQMHDLHLEEFVDEPGDGPIKTFTLRGIKDSPPYLHDGRCLTLEDTVEFFNLVFELKLTKEEKHDLTAFMKQL